MAMRSHRLNASAMSRWPLRNEVTRIAAGWQALRKIWKHCWCHPNGLLSYQKIQMVGSVVLKKLNKRERKFFSSNVKFLRCVKYFLTHLLLTDIMLGNSVRYICFLDPSRKRNTVNAANDFCCSILGTLVTEMQCVLMHFCLATCWELTVHRRVWQHKKEENIIF